MDCVSAFSEALKRLLRTKELKQKHLLGIVGESKGFISEVVNGKKPPPLTCLTQLCGLLELSIPEADRLMALAAIAQLPGEWEPRLALVLKRVDFLEKGLQAVKAREQRRLENL